MSWRPRKEFVIQNPLYRVWRFKTHFAWGLKYHGWKAAWRDAVGAFVRP